MPTETVRLRVVLDPLPPGVGTTLSVGLQSGRDGLVRGRVDGGALVVEATAQVKPGRDGRPDFAGPCVHGRPGERFLYVTWGHGAELGIHHGFRRLKLYLGPLVRAYWDQPGVAWTDLATGCLAVRVSGVLPDGTPNCGTARCGWTAEAP